MALFAVGLAPIPACFPFPIWCMYIPEYPGYFSRIVAHRCEFAGFPRPKQPRLGPRQTSPYTSTQDGVTGGYSTAHQPDYGGNRNTKAGKVDDLIVGVASLESAGCTRPDAADSLLLLSVAPMVTVAIVNNPPMVYSCVGQKRFRLVWPSAGRR